MTLREALSVGGCDDLRLSDLALAELEQQNLRAFAHLSRNTVTRENMRAAKLPTPSPEVRQLIMRLQQTHSTGRPSQRVRVWPLRNTVAAHRELLRLQARLLPREVPMPTRCRTQGGEAA